MPSEFVAPDALFQCTQCGECCKGFGGTYITEADLQAIADFVGRSVEAVRRDCCAASGSRLVLAQRRDGYCVFWDGNCTIHPVKPRMCRQWPFIFSLTVDIGNWFVMAGSCPGMRRDIDLDDLRAYLRSNRL
jgi:Fe-S-cluster containining protein